jgi:hypothetical protein
MIDSDLGEPLTPKTLVIGRVFAGTVRITVAGVFNRD